MSKYIYGKISVIIIITELLEFVRIWRVYVKNYFSYQLLGAALSFTKTSSKYKGV